MCKVDDEIFIRGDESVFFISKFIFNIYHGI